MKPKETFATLIEQFQYHHNLSTVFDDFLTMSIAACGRNPLTGLSYNEELYLRLLKNTKPIRSGSISQKCLQRLPLK